MATPYSVPIDEFLHRIEEDIDFFQYLNLTNEQAAALATARAKNFMREACARICIDVPNRSDFTDYDDVNETFGFDLTKREVYLLASIMYEMYLARDIAKLKCLMRDYVPTDLRVFSPSDARKSFLAMYEKVCEDNVTLLETYRCTDSSGQWRLIDYAGLDVDSEG